MTYYQSDRPKLPLAERLLRNVVDGLIMGVTFASLVLIALGLYARLR
jgi:hypothetical protein